MSRKRRRFSSEFKAKVVLEILSGQRTKAEICRTHRLRPDLVTRWTRQLVEGAPTLFEMGGGEDAHQQQVADLERLVGRLTLELEAAKKVSSILSRQ